MNKKYLYSIPDFIKENIGDKAAVFVFPTDIVAQSWAEWSVTGGHTDVKSVALDRFIAWDQFKGSFMSADKKGAMAVPSLLRKMFVYDLIQKNSENPFLSKIIRSEYASSAFSFAGWLEKNLPSLHMWKKRMDENRSTYGQLDDEDRDYQKLYELYSQFLEENSLFEPSWIEKVEFSDSLRKFYILYPEQLADFSNFDEIFAAAPNVTALLMPEDVPGPELYFYKDARRELRQTMLRIIALVKEGKADWTEIALSVPDLDLYRPYIRREFKQYGIPYVFRAGISLTRNNAGRIFREISDCHGSGFAYDDLRTLLLDETIPWKKAVSLNMKEAGGPDKYEDFDLKELKESLIREGNRMRCICPYEQKDEDGSWSSVDVWEEALGNTYSVNKILLKFYRKLKNDVNRFFSTENVSFASIRDAWFNFKEHFIDDSDYSSFADKILSRCITHLEELIELEKTYGDAGLKVSSPFQFYLELLDSKKYTVQAEEQGVSVVPYKVTAGAYFKYQFVIDGSQKNLEVPYKPLSLLNSEKRRKLKLSEEDTLYNATGTIIRLYAKPSEGVPENFVHFSASEESFSGFAIPHSALRIQENVPDFDGDDFILAERKWLESGAQGSCGLTGTQLEQLNAWKSSALSPEPEYTAGKALSERIQNVLVAARNESLKKKGIEIPVGAESLLKISARGDMEKFFPCPRKWVLSQLLKLRADTLDTDLMQSYDMGNLHHKILELFMNEYMGKPLPFYDSETEKFYEKDSNPELLNNYIDETDKVVALLYGSENQRSLVYNAIYSRSNSFSDSPLVIKTLCNQQRKTADRIFRFLKNLLLKYDEEDSPETPKEINGIGGCTVCSAEGTFCSMQNDFAYYGKIDFVVKTPDTKQYVLLDYKNSKASIPKEEDFMPDPAYGTLSDFQMAVYCRLLSQDCQKEIAAAYFYAVNDPAKRMVFDKYQTNLSDSKGNPKPSHDYTVFEPAVKTCDEYAALFNSIVSSKNPDFTPHSYASNKEKMNVKPHKDCIGCNFNSICRTVYSVAGKQIPAGRNE